MFSHIQTKQTFISRIEGVLLNLKLILPDEISITKKKILHLLWQLFSFRFPWVIVVGNFFLYCTLSWCLFFLIALRFSKLMLNLQEHSSLRSKTLCSFLLECVLWFSFPFVLTTAKLLT